jgi:fumarylacetoacetase
VFAPTRALDFELEMGFVIGLGSTCGHPIKAGQFSEYVFGLVLLNDWSARDIQRWETVPLGPFQGKSFATQLGAWVVPLDALEPFRRHNPNASEAIGHLRHEAPWSFDIALEVAIESSTMRAAGQPPTVISRSNTTDLYWDGAQQLAHMTANGASTRPGDLWGTGTVSGAADDSAGCLLERTSGGEPVLSLPDGSTRGWLKDGDRVLMRGRAATEGHPTIDFGELSGTVAPALGAILEE